MPSSHALFMATFAIYITLCIIEFRQSLHPFELFFHISSLYLISFLCIIGRVYLNYHFLDQIIVGSIIGLFYGTFLYFLYRFCSPFVCKIRILGFGFKNSSNIRKVYKLSFFEEFSLNYFTFNQKELPTRPKFN